jgi:hypothetical protein
MRKDIPITRKGVEFAYRYLLGRPPENEKAYEYGLSAGTVDTLRRWILESPEFAQAISRSPPGLLRKHFPDTQGPAVDARRAVEVGFFSRHVVIHTHIEKCAGTSLVDGLRDIFGGAFCLDLRRPDAPPGEMTRERCIGVRLLTGHFHYGDHLAAFDRAPLPIATVRDPVERLVSFLRFLRQSPDHPEYPNYGDLPLSVSVERMVGDGSRFLGNGQCIALSGAPRFEEARSHVEDKYLLVLPFRAASRIPGLFADALGLPRRRREIRANVSETKPDDLVPDPALARQIREMNAEDDLLFRWVQQNEARLEERAVQRLAALAAAARAAEVPPGAPP